MITARQLWLAMRAADERKHPADQAYGLGGVDEPDATEGLDSLQEWTIDGKIDFIAFAEELNKLVAEQAA